MSETAHTYRVKRILNKGELVPIIMQNVNGPCPLIAICNVLFLRRVLSIHSDYAIVDFSHLCNLVSDHVVESNTVNNPGSHREDVEFNVNDVIQLMPKLELGLDVNVKFGGIQDFEFTKNLLLFDLLQIRLVHGWLIDPQDTRVTAACGKLSYNQVVEGIINMREVQLTREQREKQKQELENKEHKKEPKEEPKEEPEGDPKEQQDLLSFDPDEPEQQQQQEQKQEQQEPEEPRQEQQATDEHTQNTEDQAVNTEPTEKKQEDGEAPTKEKEAEEKEDEDPKEIPEETEEEKQKNDEIIQKGLVLEEFLKNSAGQLTYCGLQKLHEDLQEGELVVFFRNNHFSTMIKWRGELYSLITDVGYHDEHIVWEKICEIDGNSVYVTADFNVPPPPAPLPPLQQQIPPADTTESTALTASNAVNAKNNNLNQSDVLESVVSNCSSLQEQQEEIDHMMALQMLKEDERVAAAYQQQQQQPPPQQQPSDWQQPAPHHHHVMDELQVTTEEANRQRAILEEIQRQHSQHPHAPQASPVPASQPPHNAKPRRNSNNRQSHQAQPQHAKKDKKQCIIM